MGLIGGDTVKRDMWQHIKEMLILLAVFGACLYGAVMLDRFMQSDKPPTQIEQLQAKVEQLQAQVDTLTERVEENYKIVNRWLEVGE